MQIETWPIYFSLKKKKKYSVTDSVLKQFIISVVEERIYVSIFIEQAAKYFSENVIKTTAILGVRKHCWIIFLRIKFCANFIVYGRWGGKNLNNCSISLPISKCPALQRTSQVSKTLGKVIFLRQDEHILYSWMFLCL